MKNMALNLALEMQTEFEQVGEKEGKKRKERKRQEAWHKQRPQNGKLWDVGGEELIGLLGWSLR